MAAVAQAIEVLLKARAYVVKRLESSVECTSEESKARLGQITWSKYGGPIKAWSVAASRAGFQHEAKA